MPGGSLAGQEFALKDAGRYLAPHRRRIVGRIRPDFRDPSRSIEPTHGAAIASATGSVRPSGRDGPEPNESSAALAIQPRLNACSRARSSTSAARGRDVVAVD
jgi:hypothetical protein